MNREIQPRLVRLKDAPDYLGVDKNFFNREVRPCLTEVRIGKRVSFDRIELDNWVDGAKRQYGQAPRRSLPGTAERGPSRRGPKESMSMRDLARRVKQERRGK